MSKKAIKILVVVFMAIVLSSTAACGVGANLPDSAANATVAENVASANENTNPEQLSSTSENVTVPDEETYNEGVVLVKYEGEMTAELLGGVDVESVKPLYLGSQWYTVTLNDSTKTVESVKALSQLGKFAAVDYDYIMGADGEVESIDTSCNPDWGKQEHHHGAHRIPDGWKYNKDHGKEPGGSNDVIVAVIDTGVDYNHIDLRNNIWRNSGEIPGNGIDDDGNGYVDDVYGWDFVGNNNDPMDDNGHGTHVAGIIAAENNEIGGVGVAYNSKVMVLKAGNSSGYFNNSDIAEAIQYAYMNGASVINMSFGGSMISIAVEEALENAYNSCVLVAAAGNDGACNNLACLTCINKAVCYPAALPYVIGVMSVNSDCTATSSFSNYDHYPYNSIEYEVYAVGESVFSTWPNNKYATLNGTSMAAPYVSGMAALLRTAYPDREVYSTKYLQSQIVNTGTINIDGAHTVANVYEAMTRIPTPEVNLYDYYIDDSTSISANNNGNGVMDAGETVRLFVSLHNRGGVASNVKVTLDTIRNNDPSLTDKYFTIVNDTVNLSDIGTYSVREANENQYFEIQISGDCPNDYLANFNVKFTYTNGMDNNDMTVYNGGGTAQFNVSKGYYLPSVIEENAVLTNDKEYIVAQPVLISPGVTITIEEGCVINRTGDYSVNSISVGGILIVKGSSENLVQIGAKIKVWGDDSYIDISYAELNDSVYANNVDHCIIHSSIRADTINNSVFCEYGKVSGSKTQVLNCVFTDPIFNYPYTYNSKSEVPYDKCVFYSAYAYESIMPASLFVSGSTNVLLNQDAYAKPIIHNVNGLMGRGYERNYVSIYAPDYNTSLTMEKNTYSLGSIYWGTTDQDAIDSYIYDFYDDPGWAIIDKSSFLNKPPEDVWPFLTNVRIFNKNGEEVDTISNEEVTFVVEFNRDMDISMALSVKFGTIEPYADYAVKGEFENPRKWVGKYTLKSNIENGLQYINISNGRASDDHFMTLYEPNGRFGFNIDTTAAMSMNLQANATENGIELTLAQDDYDTLLGYNIYRSESKDGNYVKLNSAILLPDENTFLDDNAEPGKTYWYTYTVVLTDFTESNPAGKVTATAMDTVAPNVYHTPVNQGYMNNNLVVSCTASDNVGISSVTLYYRTVGATTWKTLVMSKQNDKYSATIFGSELTLDGIEYYIVASDGRNTINKGSAETPYTVVIKDASAISRKGDVDGDGVVTTKDALMLMQCINGDLILSDDEFKRADLNGDGILSSYEALRILQYINGNISTLEM